MQKIQRISRYFVIGFNVLLVVLPLLIICQWAFIETDTLKSLLAQGRIGMPVQTPEGYVNLSTVHWSLLSKVLGFMTQILGILPLYLGLFFLKKIFQWYERGEVFTSQNVIYYRRLGCLFILNALFIKPLEDGLMVVAVTLNNAPGHRYLTLGLGTPAMEAIFCGTLLIVISWVMLEALKLHNDQQLVI